MINTNDYFHSMRVGTKVLENNEAVVLYFERSGKYEAIEKRLSGKEYTYSGLYHRSTSGDFKRCKKAFEKYSPKTMMALQS